MRHMVNLNDGWLFAKDACAAPAVLPENWERVSLPHTWNAIDGQDGGNDYFRGTCCYAKSFSRASLPAAARYFLEINGANSSATVWLNGVKLARHDGGYSTWRVELTAALASENLLAITVDNSSNDQVYPQMADFTFYGGLYRNVNIICVGRSHFDLEYCGGPGIAITPEVWGSAAQVATEVYLTDPKPVQQLRYILRDASGCVISDETLPVSETKHTAAIENVRLWRGRKDPYLYTAEVQLTENGAMLDAVSARFGCRSFEIDPERGFILNGEEYALHGVSRHQDRKGVGNALLPEHHREDMDLICEMGATTIRLAHYQHDQYFYDLCDERGLVVWAEIPYISRHMPDGRENTVSQMRELIVQNYNHPSIAVWGLSNEITMTGESDPDMQENHRILNELCHSMDPTRRTVLAALSMCDIHASYLQIPDVVSYNHYFGWYGGDTSMNGPWLDDFHAEFPLLPIGLSEYGCEALNWHSSRPMQGDYTEEYQAHFHEELIKQLFTRKYLWATHVWNMFDFGADARSEGGEDGQNHKGLVTFDRKYKKDSFYAYKAWLSDEPFVHICGKRYVDRVEDVTRITVYSNQPEVELLINGASLGTQHSDMHFFYFDAPNSGESVLRAVAGECADESRIRKVDTFNEAYRLKVKGAVLNWFDITEPEGRFSLNDSLGDIMGNPESARIIGELMAKLTGGSGEKDKAAGLEISEEARRKMMSGFTALRLINMQGGSKLTKEELLNINARLNEISRA